MIRSLLEGCRVYYYTGLAGKRKKRGGSAIPFPFFDTAGRITGERALRDYKYVASLYNG
jgi:hypothetical protein